MRPFLAATLVVFFSGLTLVFASSPAHCQDFKEVLGSKRQVRFALRGKVYFLPPHTTRLPDFSKLRTVGTVYAKELNVTSRSFNAGFPGITKRFEWFAIDYSGTFRIRERRTYVFRLTSDDGAILFIDSQVVINNDGLHAPTSRVGRVELKPGLHKIRVQYFQGPRHQIALVLEAKVEGGSFAPFSIERLGPAPQDNWMEVLMDTTTLVATFGLLAFMVERLTNGIAVLLSYWGWWRQRMEVSPALDLITRGQIERNRRVGLFALSALLGVGGALVLQLDLLGALGLPIGGGEASADAGSSGLNVAGPTLTGLLVASGADPIRELLRRHDSVGEPSRSSKPVEVTGTLVLQQTSVRQSAEGQG